MAKGNKSDGVQKMTPVKKLNELLKISNNVKSRMDEAKGELGGKIADAVENHNLHKGAFAQAAKLKRMDSVKLRSFLDNFDYYRDVLKLDDLAASQLPLEGGNESEEEENEGETENDEGGDGDGGGEKKMPPFDDEEEDDKAAGSVVDLGKRRPRKIRADEKDGDHLLN